MDQTFRIRGMHCSSCAAIIEKTVKKLPGVASAQANYGTEAATISFDETKVTPEQLSKSIEPLGYSFVITASEMVQNGPKKEQLAELKTLGIKVFSVLPLAAFSIVIMSWDALIQFRLVAPMPPVAETFFHHLLPIFATYTLFIVGTPYLLGVYRFIRYRKANMDTLIGIGTLAAFLYSFAITSFENVLRPYLNVNQTYYDVTIVVIAFISLGKYLEMRSKIKTGDAIEKLLNLQAKTAVIIRDGKEIEVPIQEVKRGDLVIVKSGTKIPVDGVITEGSSFIDESMMTGEPMPVEKNSGEKVAAGTMNTTGSFTLRATGIGSETLLSHIIKMVEDAQGSKAPIQALADKISSIFVPIVIVIAFTTLGLWLTIGTSYLGLSLALSYGLTSFVGVLVIACPCALGLATPTAIIVGVGKGAREGILVKDAATLQKLHKVTVIVVDKTGTITKGKPELTSVKLLEEKSEERIISLLASLEARSEHPIATAILARATADGLTPASAERFEMLKGKGVKGVIAGTEYFAGNATLATELGLPMDLGSVEQDTREGKTPVVVMTKEKILGIVLISDSIKPEAKEAVATLHKLGIKVIMATGDDTRTAHYIAKQVDIDEVLAQVMPQDKLNKIKALQAEGAVVAMAGDGVNDAPALAQADVGVAMATGTDVAIESAGITLLGGDLSKLVKAIKLSKLTMRGIKQNLFWAFAYNVIGIPLASGILFPFFGWLLSPIFAGAAMALSSVSVVGNSLRIKNKKI
jgi:Cu2+-exporting ATPase/Cu+-exporting ATPase